MGTATPQAIEAVRGRWPCWIEVDLDAVRHNVAAVQGLLDPGCQVMAIVKSQAYGHGMMPVARAALDAGVGWLGVSRVREGVQLREGGLECPILLLGPMAEPEIPLVVAGGLRPTVVSEKLAEALSEQAVAQQREVPVHLKLDTGLGRYGASLVDVSHLAHLVSCLPGLRLEGLYSHFATADDEDGSYAASQVDRFHAARYALEGEGLGFSVYHMAASGGALGVSGSQMGMIRLGLALYGLYPAPHLARRVHLRPALSVHSRVARVFPLEPGDSVGYGRTFVADRPGQAVLVPFGYADGLPRSHSNQGYLLINGRRARVIGRVSMDQCVADVSDCGPVRVGDPVVVIGEQGGECISCDEFAERSGTISYEAITSLGYRVPRVYLRDGRVVGIGYLDEGRVEEA